MMRSACPICDALDAEPVLHAERQPVLLNHLLPTHTEALAAPSATLSFRGCRRCGFVWNAAFDAEQTVYGPGYVNDQSGSAVFRAHLDQAAQHLATLAEKTPGSIVEVGCGQGGFLIDLCQRTGRYGIGFDPALTRACEGPVTLRPTFFEATTLETQTALIYSRHVLEHIAEPSVMLRAMASALDNGSNTASSPSLAIEVPTFEWIERHAAFFDLFNEHCSLFSPTAIAEVFAAVGLTSTEIRSVFGGQYLFATGHRHHNKAARATPPRSVSRSFSEARDRLHEERAAWSERVAEHVRRGPLVIWGAAAKGVSFVNHLRLSVEDVPFLIDINPSKAGRHVPLTGQPVLLPEEAAPWLRREPRATVLIMNPNYEREIVERLASLGVAAQIDVARKLSFARRSTTLEVHP